MALFLANKSVSDAGMVVSAQSQIEVLVVRGADGYAEPQDVMCQGPLGKRRWRAADTHL